MIKVSQAVQASLVLLEHLEIQDLKGLKDLLVSLDHKVFKDNQVPLEPLALWDHWDLLVQGETLELVAIKVLKEILDLKDLQVNEDSLVSQVPVVPLDLLVHKDPKEM